MAPAAPARPAFTVFEKTVLQLSEAMGRGDVTSEDIVREYLTRATVWLDRGRTRRLEQGFRMITVTSDLLAMRVRMTEELAQGRGAQGPAGSGAMY